MRFYFFMPFASVLVVSTTFAQAEGPIRIHQNGNL